MKFGWDPVIKVTWMSWWVSARINTFIVRWWLWYYRAIRCCYQRPAGAHYVSIRSNEAPWRPIYTGRRPTTATTPHHDITGIVAYISYPTTIFLGLNNIFNLLLKSRFNFYLFIFCRLLIWDIYNLLQNIIKLYEKV